MVNVRTGLKERLLELVNHARSEQDEFGALPAGHNGPYFHQETRIRTTCHWLINFCIAFRWTDQQQYRESALRAAQFLLSEIESCPSGHPQQRRHAGRDTCNGVIGAAWLLEALYVAWVELGLEAIRDAAVSLASRLCQDHQSGLWHRLEHDGRVLSIDQTFNHQLWLAASIARFKSESPTLSSAVGVFMENLLDYARPSEAGFIPHRIELSRVDRIFREGRLPYHTYSIIKAIRTRRKPTNLLARDHGYHAFNLLGFVQLNLSTSQHRFWQSPVWEKLVADAKGILPDELSLTQNKYAYPYNPTGFEMAAFTHTFLGDESLVCEWLRVQWLQLTDHDQIEYGMQTDDPITSRARIYEALLYLPINFFDL